MIVIGDDFDLASVDTALGVDFVGRQLRRLRDRGAGNCLGFGDDADLDRVGGGGLTRRHCHEPEHRSADKASQCAADREAGFSFHAFLSS